jgi:long-chain acyl-CoA synthetase
MSKLFKHIERTAALYNGQWAIADDQVQLTYAALLRLAENFSLRLNELKVERGSRIFVSGKNSADLLALVLALVKSGMNFFLVDPRSSKDDIQDLLKEIPANYLLFEKGSFDDVFASDSIVRRKQVDFCLKAVSDEMFNDAEAKLYFFSSGSTGKPKAFGFSDEQLSVQMNNLASYLQFTASDQSLVPLTITHSHGLMLSIPVLLSGGCVHYLSPENSKPEMVLDYVGKNDITVLTGVPYQYNQLLQVPGDHGLLASLRYAFCGSAPMSEHLATAFEEKFGVRLNQAYGVSEIGPICINLFEEGDNNFKSVGKVLSGIEYKIIYEQGEQVNTGDEGELVVRSSFMSEEYLNAPEETQQTFRNGWIYTQDIVRADEYGNIYIIGRKKNFINVSGYKIYPVEVEKVLLGMKGIKDAAVFGVPDEARGQIIQAVVATFAPLTEEEILAFCKQHLASYKIPHRISIENELQHGSIHKVSYAKYIAKGS